MAVFLIVQLYYPYLPLYSIAYMLGTSLLHTFVVNDEREEICKQFKNSPVFRIGGDEFVALLERTDFDNRHELMTGFEEIMDHPDDPDCALVAMGLSDYIAGKDKSFNDVFVRADKQMYMRKKEMKAKL